MTPGEGVAGIEDAEGIEQLVPEELPGGTGLRSQQPIQDAPSGVEGPRQVTGVRRVRAFPVRQAAAQLAGRAVGGIEMDREGEKLGGGPQLAGPIDSLAPGQGGEVARESPHRVGVEGKPVPLDGAPTLPGRHEHHRRQRPGQRKKENQREEEPHPSQCPVPGGEAQPFDGRRSRDPVPARAACVRF